MSESEPINIAGREIGQGHPCFIIAEVAQAHDGSLGTAHAYIDAAADAGADAVKFQTHIADYESTLDEPFRVKFSRQDATRFAYWKRMEFSAEQWAGLAEHAAKRELVFLSSAFSLEAVELLSDIGMPAWKVGSGETGNTELLAAMACNGAPILLSSGMSSYAELDASVAHIRNHGVDLALFQCSSKYPTALADVGLNVLHEMRARFACPVGLSDHSGSVHPGLAAMAQGANLLEVHIALSRRVFGPDTVASVTVDELATLTAARDAFQKMAENPVDKDGMVRQMDKMRGLFTKSWALRDAQAAGTVLTSDMLVLKKPGSGFTANQLDQLVGRRLVHRVAPDRLIRSEDLED